MTRAAPERAAPSSVAQSARPASPEALDEPLVLLQVRPWAALLASLSALWNTLRAWRSDRRVRTPTVLQMEVTECGAASLAMMLAYYGRRIALEELRVSCGVTRDGSKASNLVRAARGYGLLAKGYMKEAAELRELPLPLIAFWSFTHFLVVEGFGSHSVYLNDPAAGRREVSWTDFAAAYSGVALVMLPGPDFSIGGPVRSLSASLRRRLVQFEWLLAAGVVVSILLLAPGLGAPLLAQTFIDQVLVQQRVDQIRVILLGVAAAVLARGVLTWLRTGVLERLEAGLTRRSSYAFVAHALRLPMEFYAQRYAGDISARVAINERVAQLLSGELAGSALSASVVVAFAILMARYDARLTLVTLGVATLNLAVFRVSARQRADAHRALAHERGKLMGAAFATLESIETIKANGAESASFVRWAGYQARALNAAQAVAMPAALLGTAPGLLAALNLCVVLGIGAALVIEGELTPGMLIALQALMFGLLAPINQLVGLGSSAHEVEGELQRLDDVMDAPADTQVESLDGASDTPMDMVGTAEGAAPGATLELRGVSFGYNRVSEPLVVDVSFGVEAGGRAALVGGSGSGKSTIARLVCGLYQPWSGMVLIDGQPRAALPRARLATTLASVDQEVHLFAGSVLDNLTLWDASVPFEHVVAAARDAAIHDDIIARLGGYQALLDEGGRDLSGGQRQRLEIARALVRNPRVLVLDEATSALDAATEQRVMENLRQRGCTTLLVAHRLSTVRDVDEILVFEDGRVVQRGTHGELVQSPGRYRELYTAEPTPLPDADDDASGLEATLDFALEGSASSRIDNGAALRRAFGAVANAMHATMSACEASEPLLDQLTDAAHLSPRPVRLRAGWWRQDLGPLLGFQTDGEDPLALLPSGRGGYRRDDTGEQVTASAADGIAPAAVAFYPRLPARPVRDRELIRFGLRQAERDVAGVLVLGVLGGLLTLVPPLAIGYLFGESIPSAQLDSVLLLVTALGVAFVTLSTVELLQRLVLARVATHADARLQAALWERLLTLPTRFFRGMTAGDLGERAMGVATIHHMLSEVLAAGVLAIAIASFNLALLWTIDRVLAAAACAMVGAFLLLTLIATRFELGRRRVVSDLRGRGAGIVVQLLRGLARLRVAAAEHRALRRWALDFDATQAVLYRADPRRFGLVVSDTVFPLLATLVLYALATRGGTPQLSASTFIAFSTAFAAVLAGVYAVNRIATAMVDVVPAYERITPILRATPEGGASRRAPRRLAGELSLRHVSFRYAAGGPLVLDDLSLDIRAGECVALVGASGSGKSTVLRLLLGFESPDAGCVCYDGNNLRELDVRAVRRQLGVVLQNGLVMPGSILDNIIGATGLSLADAWHAAEQAGFASDIRRLPMGMYTVVSEGGATFSGGQRQRLLIARALARRPSVLLFDEATSALDNATQADVQRHLQTLEVTRLIVAHRLSTIAQADQIIVLEQGRIVQRGSYAELSLVPGVFRSLAERQMLGADEPKRRSEIT
ncbi:MAG: NHLP family bacteriocin export ABC transporter peptidase/permease/ATPase subunit [Chloroflexi bacterium]|nr:NHLP family bacteriocin export ABC transporter peptidase/permease/ATPase subunit [Chloroflexota bacterium]